MASRNSAQGALEYLLLIGGAVVVAVIVIFVVIGLTAPAGDQAEAGLDTYRGVLAGQKCGDNECQAGEEETCPQDCLPPPECATDDDCDDADPCTTNTCSGTPAACSYPQIIACAHGDGCCPAGCDNAVDNDCAVPPTGQVAVSPLSVNMLDPNDVITLACTTDTPGATCSWYVAVTDPGGIGGFFSPASATGETVTFSPNSVGFYTFKLVVTDPETGASSTEISQEVESYFKETFDDASSISSLPSRSVHGLWEWANYEGDGRLHGTNCSGPCADPEECYCNSSAIWAVTGITVSQPYSVELDFKYLASGTWGTIKSAPVAVVADWQNYSTTYRLRGHTAGWSTVEPDPADNDDKIKIVDSSVYNSLLEDDSGSAWQPGTWNHFKLVRSGNALSGSFALDITPGSSPAGQAITNVAGDASAVDSSPLGAGKAGVYMNPINVFGRDIHIDNLEIHRLG